MNTNKIIPLILILTCGIATAQNIDVTNATTSALITVSIRFVIAFCFFKILTKNIERNNLDTPEKNGRWIGACMMGISILTNPTKQNNFIDMGIMAILWLAIGFTAGFVWRKLKPLNKSVQFLATNEKNDEIYWERAAEELNSNNKNEGLWAKCFAEASGDEAKAKASYLTIVVTKLKQENLQPQEEKNKLFYFSKISIDSPAIYAVASIVIIFSILLYNQKNVFYEKSTKDITFNVLQCSDYKSSTDNCERRIIGTAKFTPNKDTNKVLYEFFDSTNQKANVDIDCNVIDDKNWRCDTAESVSGKGTEYIVGTSSRYYEMTNGVPYFSGFTAISSYKGIVSTSYVPSLKFIAQ